MRRPPSILKGKIMTTNYNENIGQEASGNSKDDSVKKIIDAAVVHKAGFYAMFLQNEKFCELALGLYQDGGFGFEKFKMELKDAGVPPKDIKAIEKILKDESKRSKTQTHCNSGQLVYLASLLNDDSIPASLVLPPAYQIDPLGQVLTVGNNPQLVSQCPIIIASKMKNISDKCVHLKIGW